jgi:hypothetical protein
MPNLRRKALGRPQRGQRLYVRTLNLGFLFALAISDFFAKITSSILPSLHYSQIFQASPISTCKKAFLLSCRFRHGASHLAQG